MNRLVIILFIAFAFTWNVSGQEPALETDLALKYITLPPIKKTAHAPVVILLHGYGSDEKDLFGLRASFPANYLVISARAPYPLSRGGYQWYEMVNTNGQRDGKKEELQNSTQLITNFIAQVVKKYDANPKAVYLMGFSQGAIMSYAVGLSSPESLKGIGVLSGVLYPSVKATLKNTPALKKMKVFIAHGTVDERLEFKYAKEANAYLTSIGLKPEFHEYNRMGHSISNEEMNHLMEWLKK